MAAHEWNGDAEWRFGSVPVRSLITGPARRRYPIASGRSILIDERSDYHWGTATMKRAILCGLLMLAGCGRPTSEDRGKESASRESVSSPAAEQTRRRDMSREGSKSAGRSPGDAAARGQAPAGEMIPDPAYTPRQEDRATLLVDATPGFSRASLFDDYYQSPGFEDRMRAVIDRGEVVELEGRVPVLVLNNLDPADAREPGRHYAVEIRILDGARKGETWFVDESAVARLVPKVVHPPLAPGSYATVARSGAIAYPDWEALDPTAGPTGDAAKRESFRLDEGTRVVVEEARGEAVRVRVHSGSGAVGRVGVVARPDLRPMLPQSNPPPSRPTAGR